MRKKLERCCRDDIIVTIQSLINDSEAMIFLINLYKHIFMILYKLEA